MDINKVNPTLYKYLNAAKLFLNNPLGPKKNKKLGRDIASLKKTLEQFWDDEEMLMTRFKQIFNLSDVSAEQLLEIRVVDDPIDLLKVINIVCDRSDSDVFASYLDEATKVAKGEESPIFSMLGQFVGSNTNSSLLANNDDGVLVQSSIIGYHEDINL